MFLFIRLFTAHLIGDFPLQTNKIYSLKTKSNIGIFYHVIMVFLASILCLLPVMNLNMFLYITAMCLIHFLIDHTKLTYNKKMNKQFIVVGFILDQLLHILTIVPISLFEKEFNSFYYFLPDFLRVIYSDNTNFYLISGVILSTFFTEILIYNLKISLKEKSSLILHSSSIKTNMKFIRNTLYMLIVLYFGLGWQFVLFLFFTEIVHYQYYKKLDFRFEFFTILIPTLIGLIIRSTIV